MRTRDDEKQEALFLATIKLVNEIGFAASSVSKIAKEAGVSPATIYVYYKNKEDLLVSTYISIKQDMSAAILENFNRDLPIRDTLQTVWMNMFNYASNYPEYHQFAVQFSSSPYGELVAREEVEKYFEPIILVLQRGIDEKILKAVNFDILAAFMFQPIIFLSNSKTCGDFEPNPENINTAFTLAWDAIKL